MFDTREVAEVGTSELESELVALAGRLAAAQCQFLLLLAEFDAREGWAGPGIRSCAHWLSWRVGLSRRAGREQLRVARALVGLPLITEAFGSGRLSYAKVRAITRIATAATEDKLVDLALAGTASHLERVVRAVRRAATSGEAFAARRSATWRWDEDGCLVLRATLPPDEGARLVGALRAVLVDGRGEPGRAPGQDGLDHPDRLDHSEEVSYSDELGHLRELGGSAEPSTSSPLQLGREHPPGAAADRSSARRADALMALLAPDTGRHELVVHLEVATDDVASGDPVVGDAVAGDAVAGDAVAGDAVAGDAVAGDAAVGDTAAGEARLADGLPIAVSTAQRLACDPRVRALIKDRAGNPLYLGRSHRVVSAIQRAALGIRDQHRCRFPGCEQQRYLHAHHVKHWLRGGRSDIDNLVLVCSFHHRLIHDQGYRATLRDNQFRVWRRDSSEISAQHPPAAVAEALSGVDLLVEGHIDDEAIVPAWSGERLDLDAVLLALFPDPSAAA